MQTSFTEGDPLNRSTTGGGFDQEIKQIKSLLGLVAQDFNMRVCQPTDFYGDQGIETMDKELNLINRTHEHHNQPPIMTPFKFSSKRQGHGPKPYVGRKSITPTHQSSPIKDLLMQHEHRYSTFQV